MKDLVQFALDQHTEFRRFKNYPLDPPYVTKKIEEEPSFKDAIENIKKELTELSCRLNNSIPFFSFRSQVMTWLCFLVTIADQLIVIPLTSTARATCCGTPPSPAT